MEKTRPIEDYPTDDLLKELEKRKLKERQDKIDAFIKMRDLIFTIPFAQALPVLNVLVPEHSRTSCSDEAISNGWESIRNGRNAPRCVRCGLLQMFKGHLPRPFHIELSIFVDPE